MNFIEVNALDHEWKESTKVLVNVNYIISVFCEDDGNCGSSIMLKNVADDDFLYVMESYEMIKSMIVGGGNEEHYAR